jgi:hypothetical protein
LIWKRWVNSVRSIWRRLSISIGGIFVCVVDANARATMSNRAFSVHFGASMRSSWFRSQASRISSFNGMPLTLTRPVG